MGGERSAVGAALPGASFSLREIVGLLPSDALGLELLGLLKAQEQLVDGQRLGPPAEAVALQLLDDLEQPIDLRLARHQHRLQSGGIVVGTLTKPIQIYSTMR